MVFRPYRQTLMPAWCLVVAFSSLGIARQSPPTNPSAAQTLPSLSTRPDFSHARILMQQGKLDEAIAELQSMEASAPNAKGLNLELGTAYYKKSDFVRAVEFLNKAAAEDPTNNEATQLLGLSYYLNGYPGQAIPLLEKVQAWFPRANVDASYILGIC
jgi:tetratricopeptide (TPR) repeat protein